MDTSLTLVYITIGCTVFYVVLSVFVSLKLNKLLFEVNVIRTTINNIQEQLNKLLEKKKSA